MSEGQTMHPTELSDRASLDPDIFRRESRIDNEGGHDCVDAAEDSSLQISSTTSSKDKRGKQVASAVLEDRRQRNRQAQATFRLRRNEHLKQLEATIQQHQQTIRDLQESVRVASDDCLMLRYKNSILERVLLEKGIDVREEVYTKPLLPTKRRVSGASSRNSSSVQCGRNKRARDTLYPGSAPAVQAPVQTKTTSSSFHVGRLVPEVFASAPATSSVAPSLSEQSQSSTSRSPRLSQWQPRTTASVETGMRTVRATKQAQDFQQAARARKHDLEHPHHNRSALQMPRPTSTTTGQSASRPLDPSRGHSVGPYSTMTTATLEEAGHGHGVSFGKTTKKPHHALGKLPPSLFCPFLLGSCVRPRLRISDCIAGPRTRTRTRTRPRLRTVVDDRTIPPRRARSPLRLRPWHRHRHGHARKHLARTGPFAEYPYHRNLRRTPRLVTLQRLRRRVGLDSFV